MAESGTRVWRMVIVRAKALKLLVFVALLAAAAPGPAAAVECWQGWGYWVDARTGAYKSQELLLATEGPADWAPGRAVALRLLDRVTGRIDAAKAPIVAIPLDPRTYYRGAVNYVDGIADIEGAPDRLVFGLGHVAPPASAIPEMEAHTAWACGLGSPTP